MLEIFWGISMCILFISFAAWFLILSYRSFLWSLAVGALFIPLIQGLMSHNQVIVIVSIFITCMIPIISWLLDRHARKNASYEKVKIENIVRVLMHSRDGDEFTLLVQDPITHELKKMYFLTDVKLIADAPDADDFRN